MEIKEILDDLDYAKNKERGTITLNQKDINLLLDYITNLQQELEEYKDTETYSKKFLYKANKDRLNANLELVKENERLKTKAKEQSLLLIDYQDMEQKYEDYKSRIEKAIKYIKENAWYMIKDDEEILDRIGIEGLLKILEGDNNEKV